MKIKSVLTVLVIIFLAGCSMDTQKTGKKTFGQDLAFLKKHLDVIVLSDKSRDSQVAVVSAYQGRVMTSTADGLKGSSFGWINTEAIESGQIQPHINVYGGEDRFWMGPEGGQYAIFFPPKAPFEFKDWQTPAVIDTEPFDLTSKSRSSVSFTKKTELTNWSGTKLNVKIDRTISLLDEDFAETKLGITVPSGVKMVAYQSDNKITNTGSKAWEKETGLLSIWILGMYNPSPETTVVVPFKGGTEQELGPIVNDEYFGKVPAERLIVKDDVMFFSGDGKYRSKIGLTPQRAKPVIGSYDASNKILTIVQYTKPDNVTDYVNSMWEYQKEPYKGDALNSYNDGPPEPGAKPLGPFYELETSSPAAALKSNESISHIHRTFHFEGSEKGLDKLAQTVLGVSLQEINDAF